MLEKIKKYIEKHHLLDKQSTVIVATSGGCDSMVLGNILHHLGYKIIVAHCNFHLRGKDSDADAAFVKKESTKYAEQCFIKDFDTKKYMTANKVAVQEAARELRYEWFAQLSKKYKVSVAVAHHLDDQIETVYFNLIRGAGIKGITGMQPKNDYIIRPLLEVSKEEIKDFAQKNNITWREDKSNESDKYTRNYIRHHFTPQLFKLNKNFYETFKREQLILNETAKLQADTLSGFLKKNLVVEKDETKLPISVLEGFVAPQSLLHHWLNGYGFNFQVIENILACLNSNKSGLRFEGTKQFILLKERKQLVLCKNVNDNVVYKITDNIAGINIPIKLSIKKMAVSSDFKVPTNSAAACLDFDLLKFPLQLRKWVEGDYFFPLGMKNKKKLSDFFIDKKIDVSQKKDVWLLCSGKDVVWVVGHRIDERYKISSKTRSAFQIACK